MLVVALALVVLMMRQLRQPETAARLEKMLVGNAAPAPRADVVRANAAAGPSRDGEFVTSAVAQLAVDASSNAENKPEADADVGQGQFRKLLALAGWDAERLAKFGDGEPLSDDQRKELLDLLRRLNTFDRPQLAVWARGGSSVADIVANPAEHRGELVHVAGRVTSAALVVPPIQVAIRSEISIYYVCQLELAGQASQATVVTARVPKVWTKIAPLDEPAEADAVFITLLPADGPKNALLISREIAWHPREVREPDVSFGESLLGMLGMDVGLLDTVEQRQSIRATEREAFYQMLDAVGRAGANQLIRSALGNLEEVGRQWAAEADRTRALARQSSGAADDADRKRLMLAQEVERRVAEGRYSVGPLFNDPQNQVGQLVALEGVARRAVRIDVGKSPDGTPSDVRRRFDIDHYFEMDLFTDDSQNNPVVFCVRELPPGFPTGESIREPVRVAGFFFKSWSFRSRRAASAAADDGEAVGTRQFAPLLVGRGPIWLQPPSPAHTGQWGWILGGSFILLLAAIWAAMWWFGRGGQRYQQRVLPERLALPGGQSPHDHALWPDDGIDETSPPALGNTGDEDRLQ